MLSIKFDRLNQLIATISEINEIKSQLLAELGRLEKIEMEAISEISDIESEILSTTQIVIVPTDKLADATLKDSQLLSFDSWEKLTKDSGIWLSDSTVYVYQNNKLIEASTIVEGGTNSPLQKAIDTLYGYSQARYYYSSFISNKLPEIAPSFNLDTGREVPRIKFHANHCRKQVWYSYCTNPDNWFYIDWSETNAQYWINLAKEINPKTEKPENKEPVYNPINRGRKPSHNPFVGNRCGEIFPSEVDFVEEALEVLRKNRAAK